MVDSSNLSSIRSYIIACCADGKINKEEYLYLKKQSERYKISEGQLNHAIHEMLLSMGKEKKTKNDYKSCVIYTKEALKFQPEDRETITILSNAIGSLNEEDLLDLARTTINGLEIYKDILFEKIKQKGNNYHSEVRVSGDPSKKAKALKFLRAASVIYPGDDDVHRKLNELLGRSGFELVDDTPEIPDFPDSLIEVQFFKKGGMANIFTARYNDPDSRWHERKLIIKHLCSEKAGQPQLQRLFFKEYNILRDLDHPNIVKIIRRGSSEDLHYYLIEFVNGRNLKELIDEGNGITQKDGKRKRMYDIAMGLLHGLQGIHEEGIIHRDIKPANILITNTANKVKIIDFGLAKTDEYQDKIREAGTRPYNAPELRKKAYAADNRADIYSFGIILLEMITGRNNIEFINLMPDHTIHLKNIIKKCTEERVEKRYNYISEILEEFSKNEVIEEMKWCGDNEIGHDVLSRHAPQKPVESATQSRKPINKKLIIGLSIFIAVAVLGFAGYYFYGVLMNKLPGKVEFGQAAGETKSINVPFQSGWTFSADADWIEAKIDPADNAHLLVVTKSANTTLQDRTAILDVLQSHGKHASIKIVQSGKAPIENVNQPKNIEEDKKPRESKEPQTEIKNPEMWTESDLAFYLEEIRGAAEPINYDEIFSYIDPACEVYYVIDGIKISSSEDIKTFLNKIKLGSLERLSANSIKYNNQGKISEFGQE